MIFGPNFCRIIAEKLMRRKQIVFEMKNKLVCLPFALAAVLGACGKTNENQDADLKPNSTDASKPAAAEPKTAAVICAYR